MLKEKSESLCGYGSLAFLATSQSLGNLPQALTASGNSQLPTPSCRYKNEINLKVTAKACLLFVMPGNSDYLIYVFFL